MKMSGNNAVAGGLLTAGMLVFFPPCIEAAQVSMRIPDLGGAGYGWFSVGDDLLPPQAGPGPVVSDPAHPYQSNTSGRQPTFRIADIRNSILRPWVVDQLSANNRRVLSGEVPFNARERCWPAGVPGFEVFTLLRPVYFLQTPTKVVIINEGDNQVRHVYLNVPHSANPKPSWYGESVGHYENGDTLVADTIGMNDRTYTDNYLTPHTTGLHVIERFKLSDAGNAHPSATTAEDAPRFKPTEGSKMLEVSITVDDPGAFNTVWSGIQIYRMEFQGNWDETICAENNDIPHFRYENDAVPIPQAKRPDF
ncbi:MAG TPA: hypothetical protein VFW28_13860 [Micropepsaceae bacterium]|nr:hypothetical protein [Micropepsaceae bacterium]